ncbi:MAG: hypothetical protein AAF614_07990 [Chloroflexota bacterium]
MTIYDREKKGEETAVSSHPLPQPIAKIETTTASLSQTAMQRKKKRLPDRLITALKAYSGQSIAPIHSRIIQRMEERADPPPLNYEKPYAPGIEVVNRGGGNNYAMVQIIFPDYVWSTKVYGAGRDAEPNRYQSVGRIPKHLYLSDDVQISKNDAEGKAFTEAYNHLRQIQVKGAIRVVLFSTQGPCSACKVRTEVFRADVDRLLERQMAWLEKIDIEYLRRPKNKNRGRNDVPTTYGWHDDSKSGGGGSYSHQFL